MPVRDGAEHLDESVASIMGQSVGDLELLVLDDGSRDGTWEILGRWAARDPRVRRLRAERSGGVAAACNRLAAAARAPVLARMDADDVSAPDRLRRQLELLDADSEVVLVGCLARGIDAHGRAARPRDRWRLVRDRAASPFPHGTAVIRRDSFVAAGGYREEAEGWEDLDLFLRLERVGRVVVLPDALYAYRYRSASASVTRDAEAGTVIAAAVGDARRLHAREGAAGDERVRRARPAAVRGLGLPPAARALRSAGAMRLWAGARPGVLRPLLRVRGVRRSPAGLAALAWAAWGEASPRTLRAALRGFVRTRDLAAGWTIRDGVAREWHFG